MGYPGWKISIEQPGCLTSDKGIRGMIWVLDASVAVRWFIEEEVHPHADEDFTHPPAEKK